ncbi:MAG TPA: M20/M25/M40 family metallo-hydrolase, partial [Anaerolineae bacterium]|nr:M20/M25/M40 family metallo-hydrolase [Anaerolineae bacterium]
IIRDEVSGLADEISVGKLGSLIALKKGTGQGKKVMLVAHMDEIGLMVTHIDQRGYARVTPLGTVFPLYAVGQRVRFADGRVGMLNADRRDDATKVPTLDQLYIDLGAKDKKSCPVQVGDVACCDHTLADLGGRLVAKSLDDRLGCAMLIEVLRRLKSTPHDVYCVFSVQEETTSVGARTAAYSLQPDVAIAVDVTSTGDTPKALPMAVELGKGPAIKVRDVGTIADPRVKRWMVQRAKEAKIPYQLEILREGSTDADVIQVSRDGVPSGGVLVPCRHVHSPSEMVDMTDVENGVKLLVELVKKPIVISDE